MFEVAREEYLAARHRRNEHRAAVLVQSLYRRNKAREEMIESHVV